MKKALVFSCEHASNKIPEAFNGLFSQDLAVLSTHFAYDLGAAEIHHFFSENFNCHSHKGYYSRLLIDLNRTLTHPRIFSDYTRLLDHQTKNNIIANYYSPYIESLQTTIQSEINNNLQVIHISFHSYTGVFKEAARNSHIGFLYDPKRKTEVDFCQKWRKHLLALDHQLKCRMNYPYRGISNGLTTYFRKLFDVNHYLGIELEVSQTLLTATNGSLHNLYMQLSESFALIIGD